MIVITTGQSAWRRRGAYVQEESGGENGLLGAPRQVHAGARAGWGALGFGNGRCRQRCRETPETLFTRGRVCSRRSCEV